jgi:hypothetical protein
MVSDSGLRVQGFRVFRVLGFELRVQGLESRVWGLDFGI